MAEKETKNEPKDIIEPLPEEIKKLDESTLIEPDKQLSPEQITEKIKNLDRKDAKDDRRDALDSWIPKTELGKLVKAGKEKNLDIILTTRKRILEPEIVDSLLPIETEFISIGQAKGKFGGGKRRAWRQTQKKTQEGNVLSFSTMVVVGDKQGHIGIGYGKAKETLPAREKATRQAKLNIIKINMGFEDPADTSKDDPHTIPFKVEGKCGSSIITLMPAPRGTGLAVADECKKILKLAGIKDIYSRTSKRTRTTFNLAKACFKALEKTNEENK
jgi:small subunit ribosomal protein S5